MLREESDIDPEDPDHYEQKFLPSDKKAWNSNNPQHVAEHDQAQEAFEARRQTRIFMNLNTSTYVAFGVTKEVHVADCTCSYCGNNGYDKGMKPGLNVPPAWKASNSWYVWMRKNADGSKTFYRTTRGLLLQFLTFRRSNQAA